MILAVCVRTNGLINIKASFRGKGPALDTRINLIALLIVCTGYKLSQVLKSRPVLSQDKRLLEKS